MRRSKLESYEAILEALVTKPLTVDSIAYKTNMSCTTLRKYLGFLTKNGLLEERAQDKKALYANTERGVAVLKALNFEKYIEKVTKTIMSIDDASLVLPVLSKHTGNQEKTTEV